MNVERFNKHQKDEPEPVCRELLFAVRERRTLDMLSGEKIVVKIHRGYYFYGFVHCLSYFCAGEGVGLVATEDENLAVAEELTSLSPALP